MKFTRPTETTKPGYHVISSADDPPKCALCWATGENLEQPCPGVLPYGTLLRG